MTQFQPVYDLIKRLVRELAESDKGMDALFYLNAFLTDSGCSLEIRDQARVIHLLQLAWGRFPTNVLDEIVSTLGPDVAFTVEKPSLQKIMAERILGAPINKNPAR